MTAITIRSFLDEEITVTITRQELMKIRAWNQKEMRSAQQGMDAINSKPSKRSMRREQYEFHKRLCDRLYGVDPDEETLRKEHNAELMRQTSEIDEQINALRKVRADLQMHLV